jgi:hypothetical protein
MPSINFANGSVVFEDFFVAAALLTLRSATRGEVRPAVADARSATRGDLRLVTDDARSATRGDLRPGSR